MRYPDWPTRLDKALKEAKEKGFVWGESDCCLFSCNIVKAITGIDYGASFRNRYTTQKGAILSLHGFSGGSLVDTANLIMGQEQPLRSANRGDFVLADQGQGDMLGICVGEHVVFLSKNSFVYLKLKDCKLSWGID